MEISRCSRSIMRFRGKGWWGSDRMRSTDLLIRPPCKMSEVTGVVNLVRYLVEDNEEDWVLFDYERTNSVSFVRSVIKHLLDNYVILPVHEEEQGVMKIAEVSLISFLGLEDG